MKAYVWDYKYISIIGDKAITNENYNGDVIIDCEKSTECSGTNNLLTLRKISDGVLWAVAHYYQVAVG